MGLVALKMGSSVLSPSTQTGDLQLASDTSQTRLASASSWRTAFTDETTGINSTLGDMLWNYAVFNTAAMIVRLSGERGDEGRPLNQMLFNLLAEGYWSSLFLGVRRLIDDHDLNGRRGVYSVCAVIKDVRKCRDWLNRRFYVEHVRGAVYDVGELRLEQDRRLRESSGASWGDKRLPLSEDAHLRFDELSGTAPDRRDENDLINLDILDGLAKRLTKLSSIADHVNTHIAHAGNRESRTNKGLSEFHLRDAEQALRCLKEVVDLAGRWFADDGATGLAIYQGNQFEGLEFPVVDGTEVSILDKHWRELEDEIETWNIRASDL